MKFFMAAFTFLILATALGSRDQVPHEPVVAKLWHELFKNVHTNSIHRPSDCCLQYTQRIRCAYMKAFYKTSSTCSHPGVIFLTKRQRFICADPRVPEVQNCMTFLSNTMVPMGERGEWLEKK